MCVCVCVLIIGWLGYERMMYYLTTYLFIRPLHRKPYMLPWVDKLRRMDLDYEPCRRVQYMESG